MITALVLMCTFDQTQCHSIMGTSMYDDVATCEADILNSVQTDEFMKQFAMVDGKLYWLPTDYKCFEWNLGTPVKHSL